ncbi:MAG: MTAP family purine nucleoside phosphorylase [Candidatus Thermoplasmatota archaeon]|jgi:5'-methylthioadenosine phosphorylase|nr:MTAP family purine nucleoside phosphorylase [Candidatus Thermoplasmatota archaeon]
MIGIIGGSGFYSSQKCIANEQKISVETRYGNVSLIKGTLDDVEVIFLSRHGDEIKYPPHAINHKANIAALHKMGVNRIIATSAVGVLKFRYKLGVLTLPDQLVDMSKEVNSFYNGGEEGIVHTDISDPFCLDVIGMIRKVLDERSIQYQFGGTYLSLSGPTFETKAEIRLYQGLGMTFVGMTIAAECKLARELSMCYVPILLPVNYGAGMTDELVTHDTTLRMVETMRKDITTGLGGIVQALPAERNCDCPRSVSGM